MQLFTVHEDPLVAGRQLCDKHITCMAKETAQIASTALLSCSESLLPAPLKESLYKPMPTPRKCISWAGETLSNFRWVVWHGLALVDEHYKRFGTRHKSGEVIREIYRHRKDWPLPIGPLTPFALDLPEEYHCDNPVISYRRYYIEEKSHFAVWRNASPPKWFIYRDPFIEF